MKVRRTLVSRMTGKKLHRTLLPVYRAAIRNGSSNVAAFEIGELMGTGYEQVTVTFIGKRRK